MKVLAIARQTLVELWRQRTPWGFIIIALLLAVPGFFPLGSVTVNGQTAYGSSIVGGLLNVTQFIAIFLTISVTCGLVPSDLERGTLLLLTTKPISRYQVVLGKALGAGIWMLGAWIAWGAIAALSLSIRMGPGLVLPTLIAFTASTLASWVLVSFCLFVSTWLPANTTFAMTILAWFGAASAPRLAPLVDSLGHHAAAQALGYAGDLLPLGPLSEAARGLASGQAPAMQTWLSLAWIAIWWLAAALAFSRRDLAPNS